MTLINVTCPQCGVDVALKGARAGTYRPTCPKCRTVFVLTVDAGGAAHVQAAAGSATVVAPAMPTTVAPAAALMPRLLPAGVPTASRLAGEESGATQANTEAVRAELAEGVVQYRDAGMARLRAPMAAGAILLAVAVALTLFLGGVWSLGVAALLTPVFGMAGREVALGVLGGLQGSVVRRSVVLSRVAEVIREGGWGLVLLALKGLATAVVLLAVVWALGWTGALVFMAIIGAGAGVGWAYGVDVPLAQARRGAVERLTGKLALLRAAGVREPELKLALVNAAGRDWEEVFEQLFGYDAKIEWRLALARSGQLRGRRKHAAWRDRIMVTLDRVGATPLVPVTLDGLTGEGGAAQQAAATPTGFGVPAAATTPRGVVGVEGTMPPMAAATVPAAGPIFLPAPLPTPLHAGLALAGIDPEEEEGVSRAELARIRRNRSYLARRYGGLSGLLLGSQARLLLGLLLLVGFVAWIRQNDIVRVDEVASAARQVGNRGSDFVLTPADRATTGPIELPTIHEGRAPLTVKMLPGPLTGLWCGFGAGVAGAVLLLSACFASVRLGMFVIPGAALIWLAFLVPGAGPIGGANALQWLGGVVVLAGFVFARD